MGLIRKTLAIGTIGAVKGSSKKQRVARESLNVQRAILAELRGETAERAASVSAMYDPSRVRLVGCQQPAAASLAAPVSAEQRAAERAARDPRWAARQAAKAARR